MNLRVEEVRSHVSWRPVNLRVESLEVRYSVQLDGKNEQPVLELSRGVKILHAVSGLRLSFFGVGGSFRIVDNGKVTSSSESAYYLGHSISDFKIFHKTYHFHILQDARINKHA